jgi:hypothetical protein
LYFLPDRVLVWEKGGVGVVGYDQLDLSLGEERFIEDGGVPNDTRVVDRTWRYVNKKGGPDKRFKDNREIPIVLYESILFASRTGLRELFKTSRTGVGSGLTAAVKQMASVNSHESEPGQDHIKCPCYYCGALIEFPAHEQDQSIQCPHCGMDTWPKI